MNRDVQSLAVGAPQDVPYTCPGVATVVFEDKLVCGECAVELQAAKDADRMAGWALEVRQWAGELGHRHEVNQWLGQIADGFDRTSQAIRDRGQG